MAAFTMDLVPSPVVIAPTIPAKAIFFASGGRLGSFSPGVFFTMSFATELTTVPAPAWSTELTIWSSVFPVSTPDARLVPMFVTVLATSGLLMTLFTSEAMAGDMICEVSRLVAALPSA